MRKIPGIMGLLGLLLLVSPAEAGMRSVAADLSSVMKDGHPGTFMAEERMFPVFGRRGGLMPVQYFQPSPYQRRPRMLPRRKPPPVFRPPRRVPRKGKKVTGRRISPSQALHRALRASPGSMGLGVELLPGAPPVYAVKLKSGSRIHRVLVDALSGRVLK